MIYVELPRVGRVSAQVAWTEGRLAGCRFLDPISSGALSAALLRSLPEPMPTQAIGPAGHFAPGAENELSSQHKMLILLGLTFLAWASVLGLGYAGLQLFNA